MKIKYVLLAAVFASFMACQKEPDGNILTQPTTSCKLDTALFYNTNGTVSDTLAYIYTGSQLTRVNYSSFFIKLEYTNSKISKRSFYNYAKPDSAVLFDQFSYNADGTLNIEQDYANVPGLAIPYLYLSYNYTYSGGKLTRFVEKDDTTGVGPLVATFQSDYTYSGSNVSKSITKDLTSGAADTLTYSYDSKPNYYTKNSTLFYTDDLFISSLAGEALPLVFSANNVIGLAQGTNNSSLSYLTDSKQNFKELDVNGQKSASYSYKCQ